MVIDTRAAKVERPTTRGPGRDRGRVLIIVRNLSVPFDRRVWLECLSLTDRDSGSP